MNRAQIRNVIAWHAQALAHISAVESEPIAPIARGDQLKPGEIYLANESVFTQQYSDEPLTQYAVGWRDPDLSAALEFCAPEVPVPRRFTYKEFNAIEEFLADGANDDLRAIGGEFPAVKYTGTETHAKTENRGLRIRLDLDDVADTTSVLAGGLPIYQVRTVEKLQRRLLRNSVNRAIALLSAAATNTAKTWDTTLGKDPDQDVLSDLIFGATARGLRPNRVGYSDTSWTKRSLATRAQNTPAGYESGSLDLEGLAKFFGADEVLVNRARLSTSGAALAEMLGNLVLMFYAIKGANTDDASNIKRFTSKTDSGQPTRVYVQQVTPKLVDITVEKYELIKIPSALGIRKFTIS